METSVAHQNISQNPWRLKMNKSLSPTCGHILHWYFLWPPFMWWWGKPTGSPPMALICNDKLITSVLRIGESLAYLGCIDGLRHDQHPRAWGGRGEGDREVRVWGRRGWAGGLWPLGGRVMRVEARHELILLQATSFSPWDEKTSIWYNFFLGIYIKLPRLYTISWSREGYLFCQCHRNVNWRALIKNKSVDKLYNLRTWDAATELKRRGDRWDQQRHPRHRQG